MKRIAKVFLVFILAGCAPAMKDVAVEIIDSPTGPSASEPFLYTGSDGIVNLSWITSGEEVSELRFSQLNGNAWSAPLLVDSGRNWFVNWADYPIMASRGKDFIATYLARSGESRYAYDVKFTMSSDQGKTWSPAAVLNDDGKDAEHGFVSLLPYGDNFLVTWLDGRNTMMGDMEHEGHGVMSLRAAVLDRTGSRIGEWELDGRTCDCCQTGAALTNKGPVIVYRDRSNDEIRDIAIIRWVNDAWTRPEIIHHDNWKINGCPVNGPRVAAEGDQLAIAWFSMPDGEAQVNVIFSDDNGETFTKLIRIDEGNAIGRVDVVLLEDNTAFVTWMEGSQIMGATVTRDGKESSVVMASSSDERASGFPQLTRSGDRLILAWTDDEKKTVRTAIVNL